MGSTAKLGLAACTHKLSLLDQFPWDEAVTHFRRDVDRFELSAYRSRRIASLGAHLGRHGDLDEFKVVGGGGLLMR